MTDDNINDLLKAVSESQADQHISGVKDLARLLAAFHNELRLQGFYSDQCNTLTEMYFERILDANAQTEESDDDL